jgi:hypothetical protein
MRWGAVYTRGKGDFLKGSRYAVLVDPDVLQDERTIATPWDIAARVSGSRMTDTYFDPKAIMTPRQFVRHKYEMHRKLIGDQQRVDLYMQAVVTGADWLDIEARRLLAKAYKARKPVEDMPVSAEDLGEVKFKGPLPRSAILAVLDTHNPKEYQMYVDYVRETAGIALEDTGRLERRFRK